jgi:hypothetical protein
MNKKGGQTKLDATQPLLSSDHHVSRSTTKRKTRLALTLSTAVVFGVSCLLLSRQLPHATVSSLNSNNNGKFNIQGTGSSESPVVSPGISFSSLQQGLDQCHGIKERASTTTNTTRIRHRNPRASASSVGKSLLIKNGRLWLGSRYLDGDVLIQDGLIKAVGTNLTFENGARPTTILDAEQRVVTPGKYPLLLSLL